MSIILLTVLVLCFALPTHARPKQNLHEPSSKHLVSHNGRTPSVLLENVLQAIGGRDSLVLISGLRMESSYIYRSQTLTQNYNLMHSDQAVSSAGSQNLTFSFGNNSLHERIDRQYEYDEYWLWAFPNLQPTIDYSLVVDASEEGLACFVRGQNSFFSADPYEAGGFTDAYLADYLRQQARQYALPWLLAQFAHNTDQLDLVYSAVEGTSILYPTLRSSQLGLDMIIDDATSLPFIVRSRETHVVYGDSTSDLLFLNFTNIAIDEAYSILLPRRIQTIYNGESVLEDFIVDLMIVNPDLPHDTFQPLSSNTTSNQTSGSSRVSIPNTEYPRSEVHEFFEAGLWEGPFEETSNASDVVIQAVSPDVPQIKSLYVGYPDYVQILVEFEDGLIITDAPAHRSKIILKWVEQHMNGKKITHVIPSHHHRDHAGGVGDYVAAGATLVIPEMAKEFYAKTNGGNVSMVTYTADKPFQKKDENVQFRAMWHNQNPHASDWSYSIATKACPREDDEVVVFIADVINPEGPQALRWDSGYARQWMLQAIEDGLPQQATIVGAHGSSGIGSGTQDSLMHLAGLAGVRCPALEPHDWKAGGPLC